MNLSSIIVLSLTTLRADAFTLITRPDKINHFLNSLFLSKPSTTLKNALFFAEEETKHETESHVDDNAAEDIELMTGSSGLSVESMSGSIYDKLGFKEEQIAMGIEAGDVLEWIGNRDDMIARFKRDNSGMDDKQAQEEVDRFMMDAEMVNTLIAYEQKKSRGEILPDTPQFDWFTVAISGYLVYVVGSIIKRTIDRQSAAADALDTAQNVVDAVQTAVSVDSSVALASTQGAVQASLDVIQTSM